VVLQGVRPELYALVLVLGLLSVACLVSGGRRGVAMAVLPLAVAGAVHHVMLVAALPGLAVAAWSRGRRAFLSGLGVGALLLIPALGQFAWLPLRSATDPALDFGVPRTLSRVVWSVTGAGYARSFQGLDGAGVLENLVGHGRLLLYGFGVLGLASVVLGMFWAASRPTRRELLGPGVLLIALGVAPTALQGVFVVSNPDAAGYLLGPVAVLAASAGLGIGVLMDRGTQWFRTPSVATLAGAALALSMVVGPGVGSVVDAGLAGRSGPGRLADAVLDGAPPGALLVLAGDAWTFPVLWARYGEGRRPDVDVLGLHMLDVASLEAASRRGLSVPNPLPRAVEGAASAIPSGECCLPELLLSAIAAAPGAPRVFVNEVFLPAPMEAARRPAGWLYELDFTRPAWGSAALDAHDADRAEDRVWSRTARPLTDGPVSDPMLASVLARRFAARGGFLRSRGLAADALKVLDRGSRSTPDPWAMVHLHRHRMESGDAPVWPVPGAGGVPVEFIGAAERLELRPLDAALAAGTFSGSEADLRALRGTIRLVHGDSRGAREDIGAVLESHPDHPRALPAAERLLTLGHGLTVTGGPP
jgi:hypothetical protein